MYILQLTKFKNLRILLTHKYFIIINKNGILKFSTNFFNLNIEKNNLYLDFYQYKTIDYNLKYYFINHYYLQEKKKLSNLLLNYYKNYLTSLYTNVFYASFNYRLTINLKGIGYKYVIEQHQLKIRVGYSHFINYPLDKDIYFVINNSASLILYSNNQFNISKVAAFIKLYKKSNLYKGTGIFYDNEYLNFKKKNTNKNKNVK